MSTTLVFKTLQRWDREGRLMPKRTSTGGRGFVSVQVDTSGERGTKNHSLSGAVSDCGFHEIRRQLEDKAAMRGGRIMIADRFYPSPQICSCGGCLTGPKGRAEMRVEQWILS